jgi:amino-acid N-acetyltransferase
MLKACLLITGALCFSNFSTYEVATACALAIGADKLICLIDGPIRDESGHLIRFLTLQEADMLIRERAKQSEIAANYVKAVDEEDRTSPGRNDSNGAVPSQNGNLSVGRHNPTFHNGVGFDNGNGTGEQGFPIGGHERQSRLNGYLSELAAAAFVCKVSPVEPPPPLFFSIIVSSDGCFLSNDALLNYNFLFS